MMVYTDKLSGDEIMTSDYNIQDSQTPGLWEIDGKLFDMGSGGRNITGADASAGEVDGEAGGGDDTFSTKAANIVREFRLNQIPEKPSKTLATTELKNYCTALAKHIKQRDGQDAMNAFQEIVPNATKKILANWDDYDVYLTESMPEEGMWILMNFRADGVTPFATIWKNGVDAKQF